MEGGGNGTGPGAVSQVKSGSNRLRSSSNKKVTTPCAAASAQAAPGAAAGAGGAQTTVGSLATTSPTQPRLGSLIEPRAEKSKQVVKKEHKEKKEKKTNTIGRGEKEKKATASTTTTFADQMATTGGGPSGPPLLYFSASAVPTVTHPELPSQLDKFLVTPGMDVVDGLVSRLRVEDMSDVCSDLSTIFEVHGQTRRLIQWAVRKELAATTNSSSESTLFRQTGVATCMVSIECKRKGGEYLVALLRPFIQKICSETKSMEVDPLRVRSASPTAAAEDLESNRRRLVEASQDALDLIFASASSFPEALKHTFLIAHNEILQKLPNMRWTAISNFYFLRFVAPALVSPKASGVYEGNPSPQALRALMLISKTLSNAANGVPFGDKEGYMAIMNSVILDNQPRMQRFLEKLIGVADTDSPDTQATLATFPLQTDLHTARCRLLAALYSNRNAVLPALMNTPTPVPGWTPPARMSLSGNSASVASRGDSDRKNSEPVAPTNDRDDKSAKGTLGEMLGQLLDAYRVHCPDWVSDEDKETKKRVQDELIERFEEGLAHTMRPVTPLSIPSGRLYRLLLDVEKQRTKELEEELRIIKLKLNTETQAKRDLQLQILRGNNAPSSNGPSAGLVRERQRVAGQFVQMYDMLSTFRGRIVDLERLVLNEAATEGASVGGSVPSINFQQGQGWSDHATSQTAAAGAMLSPRSRARLAAKDKDKAKAQKRRSWNLKLGNPLIHNP